MAYEYLFAALPSLPDMPGGRVEISGRELCSMLRSEGSVAEALGLVILMAMDLKALERMELGAEPGETALFSTEDLNDRGLFPFWLSHALEDKEIKKGGGAGLPFDYVWSTYYQLLAELAKDTGCRFLSSWVPWDVGLRDALATHRARALGFSPEEVKSGADLGLPEGEFKPLIEALVSIKERDRSRWRDMDRLVAAHRLDYARRLAPSYTFELDELVCYVVRFIVLRECMYLRRGTH